MATIVGGAEAFCMEFQMTAKTQNAEFLKVIIVSSASSVSRSSQPSQS